MKLLDRVGMLVARRWLSGITIADALEDSRAINSLSEKVMINYLGEGLAKRADVSKNVMTYVSLLRKMKSDKIKGCISVKPTQLGLCIGYSFFLENYGKVISVAAKAGVFVWTDMEEPVYINSTIKAYLSMLKKHNNVGICMQARVKRTYDDIKHIVSEGGRIRLVKGAYKPIGGINYMTRNQTNGNYVRCMHYLFSHSKSFMIATHDYAIIGKALRLRKRYKGKIMFAMLKGIRPSLAVKLSGMGQDIYIYLPFGEEWLSYSMRRLKEVSNIILVVRSLLVG